MQNANGTDGGALAGHSRRVSRSRGINQMGGAHGCHTLGEAGWRLAGHVEREECDRTKRERGCTLCMREREREGGRGPTK